MGCRGYQLIPELSGDGSPRRPNAHRLEVVFEQDTPGSDRRFHGYTLYGSWRFAVSSAGLSQSVEKGDRRDDVDIRVVDVQVQKVRIVADEVRCAAVRGAQEESDVILVDRIVAEVEVLYRDSLGEKRELPHKSQYYGFLDATLTKFEGILRSDVSGNEKDDAARYARCGE
jgi:hypothetical protein